MVTKHITMYLKKQQHIISGGKSRWKHCKCSLLATTLSTAKSNVRIHRLFISILIWLCALLSSYSTSFFFLFISCSLSISHSCLMRRSRTAKRMNHAEWVPAVLLCPCVSALWSADLAVIRAEANSRGSRLTRSNGEQKMMAVSVVQTSDICRLLDLSCRNIFKRLLHWFKNK